MLISKEYALGKEQIGKLLDSEINQYISKGDVKKENISDEVQKNIRFLGLRDGLCGSYNVFMHSYGASVLIYFNKDSNKNPTQVAIKIATEKENFDNAKENLEKIIGVELGDELK